MELQPPGAIRDGDLGYLGTMAREGGEPEAGILRESVVLREHGAEAIEPELQDRQVREERPATIASYCIPVPAAAELCFCPSGASEVPVPFGICWVCHGATRPGRKICRSCEVVKAQLPFFCPTVLPISLTTVDCPLHRALVDYKASSAPPSAKARARQELSKLLEGFLARHWRCLATASKPTNLPPRADPTTRKRSWASPPPAQIDSPPRADPSPRPKGTDLATGGDLFLVTVPRSRKGPIANRLGPRARPPLAHPLEKVLARACYAAGMERPSSPRLSRPLVRGTGALGHRLASPDAYLAIGDLSGTEVVVVEDTYASGAHAQSAACALALAGARVLGILAIGRMVNPSYSLEESALWKAAKSVAFDESVCCLE
jgi:hypothetical protein